MSLKTKMYLRSCWEIASYHHLVKLLRATVKRNLSVAALDPGVMKYQGNIPEITRFINSQFTWLIAFRGALFARVKGKVKESNRNMRLK